MIQRNHIEKFSSVSTFLAMPVPLFNRNQGNIINARGVLVQQQKEYERLRLALSDQLATSFRTYLTLRAQAQRLEKEVLPLAKENLELTTQAYKAGRIDFLRVLNAPVVLPGEPGPDRGLHRAAQGGGRDSGTPVDRRSESDGDWHRELQTTPGTGTSGLRGVLLQQLQEQKGTGPRNLPGVIQAGEK